jgi:hypothetical protein
MTKRQPAKKKLAKKKSAPVDIHENKVIAHIGQRCEEMRNSLNISRRDMAVICGGVSYQMILNFERKQFGSVTLLTQYLSHLNKIAHINPAWILLADNSHISKYIRTYAEIARQVRELTEGKSVDGI